MSCLDATFTLKPKSPTFVDAPQRWAVLSCHGADFLYWAPTDLSSLYLSNRFYFDAAFAADPTLDYSQYGNRRKSRHLKLSCDLTDYGSQKQLALVFGFDVLYSSMDGRVQVYSDAALLADQTLVYGDNQFLLEVESLDTSFHLYFIHTGSHWFFKGISGYVV